MKLFDEYVKDTLEWMRVVKSDMDIMYEKSAVVNKSVGTNKIDDECRGASDQVLIMMQEVHSEFGKRIKAFEGIWIDYTDSITILNNKLAKQSKKITEFETKGLIEAVEEFNRKSDLMLDLVDRNVKNISTAEYMRSDANKQPRPSMKEENAPRYRADVKTEDIVRDYKAGISVKDLAIKYNMGENGIRERLKRAGEWRHEDSK